MIKDGSIKYIDICLKMCVLNKYISSSVGRDVQEGRLGVVDRPVRSRTVGLRTLGRQAESIDRPLVDQRHTLGDAVASVDMYVTCRHDALFHCSLYFYYYTCYCANAAWRRTLMLLFISLQPAHSIPAAFPAHVQTR
jgi:hypothetical protein